MVMVLDLLARMVLIMLFIQLVEVVEELFEVVAWGPYYLLLKGYVQRGV